MPKKTTSQTKPSDYDKVIFQLAVLANEGDQDGISDYDLLKQISNQLAEAAEKYKNDPRLGPLTKWNVCWGPHIVRDLFGKSLNTMYAVKQQDQPSYVVGIAGTNPDSALDWLLEDLWVNSQVSWPGQQGAKISAGTALGLSILLLMKPDSGAAAQGQTLLSFLESVSSTPITVTVTGHSLGGVLSPTLALFLRETQGIFAGWDPDKNATVTTLAFAGPTAGNQSFATYFNTQLPHAKLPSKKAASFRYANSLDIVPYAWNDLEALKTLYVPNIPESSIIDDLVEAAENASQNGDYTQIAPSDPPWTGTFRSENFKPYYPPSVNYLNQALAQHVDAYLEYFALPQNATFASKPARSITVPPIVEQRVEAGGEALPRSWTVSSGTLFQRMSEAALREGAKQELVANLQTVLTKAMTRS